jgi:hypothetical protein
MRSILIALAILVIPVTKLGSNPPAKQKSVKELSDSLRDPKERMDALLALLDLKKEARPVVADLITTLGVATGKEKEVIVTILGQIGPASEPAIPMLIGFFDDENGFLGVLSAFALVHIGDKSIPFIIKPLVFGSDVSKQLACECFRLFGAKAKPFAVFLIPCLLDRNPAIRSRAERAFRVIWNAS